VGEFIAKILYGSVGGLGAHPLQVLRFVTVKLLKCKLATPLLGVSP